MTQLVPPRISAIQSWANANEGWIALLGIALAAVIAVAPPALQVLSPILTPLPQLHEVVQRYGTTITTTALTVAVLIASWQLRRQQRLVSDARSRLSHIERLLSKVHERLAVIETVAETPLEASGALRLDNWAHDGGWLVIDGALSIQGGRGEHRGYYGGIYKIGRTWENYDFCFEFRIVSVCAGWIVRASTEQHFVMLQCTRTNLRIHTCFEAIIDTPDGLRQGVPMPLEKEVTYAFTPAAGRGYAAVGRRDGAG